MNQPRPEPDDLPPQRPRSRVRRLGRGLGWLLLTLLGLVGALLVFLHTGPGRALLREKVRSAIAARIDGTVELAELELALFGELRVAGLTVRDAAGAPVVSLGELRVVPAWRELLAGRIVVRRVALDGLALDVVQYQDGSSNLKRLVKPRPASPSGEQKPRRIRIDELALSAVSLTLTKPDGGKLAVSELGIDATVDGVPAERTANVTARRIAARLERTTPGGVRIALAELATGLDVALERGAGTVRVHPLSARATIERPGIAAWSTPVSLDAVRFEVKPGELGASLRKLALGLVVLDSLELSGGQDGDGLRGPQSALVAGLHLDAKQANALLGKPVLGTDLDFGAKLAGPPSAVSVDAKLETRGGKLALDGKLDASRLDAPGYDLKLVGTALASRRVLDGEGAPDVETDRFELGLKGHGARRDEIEADLRLDLGKTRIGRIVVDAVTLRGRLERGELVIRELTVDALEQKIAASGRYRLATKELHAKLSLAGDVGRALSTLRQAGIPLDTTLAPGLVAIRKGELELELDGKLDSGLEVRLPHGRIRVAGGVVELDSRVTLDRGAPDADGKRALALGELHGSVRLSGLRLSELARARGKHLQGLDGTLNGRIQLDGTKQDPRAKLDLKVEARPNDAPERRLIATLRGAASKRELELDLVARRAGSEGAPLLELRAHVPLRTSGARGVAPGRPVSVKLDLPKRRLRELLELLPKELRERRKLPDDAELAAQVEVGGTSEAPRGKFELEAGGTLAAGQRQRLRLAGEFAPKGTGATLTAALDAWLGEHQPRAAHAQLEADFPRSPLLPGGAKQLAWSLALDVPRHELATLPLPPEKRRELAGSLLARLDLAGTERDLGGRAHVALDGLRRGELGPLGATLDATVSESGTEVALDVATERFRLLTAKGRLGVASRGLIPALREGKLGDRSLAVDVRAPKRSFAELATLRPALAAFSGQVGAELTIDGTLREPNARGAVTADGFRMLDGRSGRAVLALNADAARVGAQLELGPTAGGGAELGVQVDRQELAELLRAKTGQRALQIALRARASRVELASLVPRIHAKVPELDARGTLDWSMDGALQLESDDGVRHLADARIDGKLAVSDGAVTLPGTKRRYQAIELALTSGPDALVIDKLAARESDREKAARTLAIHGRVDWEKLRPTSATLAISAHDWLLYGSELLGKPDAPRGALTAELEARAKLGAPRRTVDVWVRSVDLKLPDRADKAHWPEQTHLGDVIFLDQPAASVGVLPVAKAPTAATAPPSAAPASEAGGTDVFVHIPRPIKVQKPPFELFAHGELAVKLGPGAAKPAVRGELRVVDGHMGLGGRNHRVSRTERSRILFDAAHPAGELDLYLALAPHPVVLQDVSRSSAEGDDVRIHLTGPLSKPVSTVTGVGNADLWDLLPVHNAGRVKFTSQPDMPATQTVQVPREYDVVLLSYMAANLPHNLFLDRINAWADPHDERDAYGKVRHLEAERYSQSGTTRIRAAARPPTIGQSDAELEAAYLLVNQPRTKLGGGVVAGNRLGGGPVLFFEWASED